MSLFLLTALAAAALADGPAPAASPSPAPSPVPVIGQDKPLAQGNVSASVGVAAATNDRGELAAAPQIGLRLDGFDLSHSIHADISFRAAAAFAGGSTTDGFGAGGADTYGRFMLGYVHGDGTCRLRLAGGAEGTYQTMTGKARDEKDEKPSAIIMRRSVIEPARFEPGLFCTDGHNTVFFAPYAALGIDIRDGSAHTSVDSGGIVRLFTDSVVATAALGYQHQVGGAGPAERIVDGRFSGDVRVFTIKDGSDYHGSVLVGGDVRVTARVDADRPDTTSSSSVPNLGVAVGAHAALAF